MTEADDINRYFAYIYDAQIYCYGRRLMFSLRAGFLRL
jgi:hypothetical protein